MERHTSFSKSGLVLLAAALAALSTSWSGCGDAGMASDSAGYLYEDTSGWEPGPGDRGAMDAASSSDTAADIPQYEIPEPEEELDLDFKAPQASEHYVYIAATGRDSLVRIDAETLAIRLVAVGGHPTRVATLPDADVALVINSGTQDFSIVTSTESSDEVETIDMLPNVNTIAVSPTGDYAVVYYNDKMAAVGEPVGDFQTVAVLGLKGNAVSRAYVSVGFHPTAVHFAASGEAAFLVTDDGVSVIPLKSVEDGDITHIVPVAADPMDDPAMREVLVTPDGKYAVVRNLAKPEIAVVDLETEEIRSAPVAGLPTDLDLVPGKNRVLAVLREQKKAYVVDLKALVALPETDPDYTLAVTEIDITGSEAGAAAISSDGSTAVMYTTVGLVKAVAVLSLTHTPYAWQAYPVQKGVVGVALSNKGDTAVVLHQLESYPVDATPVEKTIAYTEGFTLFDLSTGYRKLIQTDNRWSEYLFISSSSGAEDQKAYILTPDPSGLANQVLSVDLKTYIATPIPLASRPESLVFVPDSRKVAVAQEHENGRITFIDVDTDETWSITGYELNGLIK